jgi:hypothetical protein
VTTKNPSARVGADLRFPPKPLRARTAAEVRCLHLVGVGPETVQVVPAITQRTFPGLRTPVGSNRLRSLL